LWYSIYMCIITSIGLIFFNFLHFILVLLRRS
jgi:hypothetical protein